MIIEHNSQRMITCMYTFVADACSVRNCSLLQDQYIFIHDAVYEFLTCGDTQISSSNFRVAVERLNREDPSEQCNGYEHQLRILDQVSPSPSQVNCSTALKHPDKNKGDKYLPGEDTVS